MISDISLQVKQTLSGMVRLLKDNSGLHTQIVWAPCVCMSIDKICIRKNSNQFSSIHFIKANGITSHYSGQPRTVTSSYKYAAPKKDEKANPF